MASRDAALQDLTPDPTLVLGVAKHEVGALLSRFNAGDRKDALRDMCELVERETNKLLLRLSKKGWISIPAQAIAKMSWSDQINTIASGNQYSSGRLPMLTSSDKDDLQSFRGARNLLDHRVKSKKEEVGREQQFTERMTQGPRLAALLLGLQRKIK